MVNTLEFTFLAKVIWCSQLSCGKLTNRNVPKYEKERRL
jgi:hypothetical protein